ncbi:MAG: triose-phosphate isomerase [Candidatus Omnitrophota bacterium]
MRKKIIAGNWKMYKTPGQARELARAIRSGTAKIVPDREIVLCPPFPALYAVKEEIEGSEIGLGAQNIYPGEEGAFTGEVSPLMLKELGVSYVIIGHSERRQYFTEEDEFINQKVLMALKYGLKPILCVGETLNEKEAGLTEDKIKTQLEGGLKEVKEPSVLVIAYEPVWAIGTGRNATPRQAQEVHRFIRQWLGERFGEEDAEDIRIQYGGSVKPDNVALLMAEPDIDGALVGGASLSADSFLAIAKGVETTPNG